MFIIPKTTSLSVITFWLICISSFPTYVNGASLSPFKSHIQKRESVTSEQKAIWDYQGTKIRGISLGGWFVLEPYITPSLFEQFGTDETKMPIDEYTFTKTLGKEAALAQLEKHWSTYYSEADFTEIYSYGLNLVRIPIGYWAFELLGDDPYVQGQEKYLDQAIQWARTHKLKVWIDLHGVPGSQNGFDNSGKRGPVQWTDTKENLDVSAKTLDYVFSKYGGGNLSDTVIGIEIVNEPMLPLLNEEKAIQFHYDMYYNYREKYNSNNYFLVQEGFKPIGFWNDQFNNEYLNVSDPYTKSIDASLLKEDYFNGVVIDHHHYEVFTDGQLLRTSAERTVDIQNYGKSIGLTQPYHASLVGEWSGAITDCARWLNGVGTGARYDETYNVLQLNESSLIDWSERVDVKKEHVSLIWANRDDTYEEDDYGDDDHDDFEDEEYDDYDQSEEREGSQEYDYTTRFVRRHLKLASFSTDQSSSSSGVVMKNTTQSVASSRTCSNVRNYDDFSDEHKKDIRKFIEVQLIEYERNGAGWIFWNWKTENAIEWDFQMLVKKDLFPMPLTDYKFFYTNGTEVPSKTSAASFSLASLLSQSRGTLLLWLALFSFFVVV